MSQGRGHRVTSAGRQVRRQDSTWWWRRVLHLGLPVLVRRLRQPRAAIRRWSEEAPAALLGTDQVGTAAAPAARLYKSSCCNCGGSAGGIWNTHPLLWPLPATAALRTEPADHSCEASFGLGTPAPEEPAQNTFWTASRKIAARPGLRDTQGNQSCKFIYNTELALLNSFNKLGIELFYVFS